MVDYVYEPNIYSSTLDNPGSTRVRMTVWASFDGAATWPVRRLVYGGSSAYSLLTAGPYERISVSRFNLAWLLGGESVQR
jgi:hypothetical protein